MNESLLPMPWQGEQWQQMTRLVSRGQMSHAWLFVGAQGIGKRQFVRALTAFILCESRQHHACGQCRSCLQTIAGHHPNAIYLQREIDDKSGKQKRDISIEQVRDLNERLAISSHYGQSKVAVIDPADALNQSSVNALLKTIEEPSAGSHLLLISERSQALAATLRSRCQRLRFSVPSIADSLKWLGNDKNADMALQESLGAPMAAKDLMSSGVLQLHSEWMTELDRIATQKSDPLRFASALASNKITAKDDAAAFMRWLLAWLNSQLRLNAISKGTYAPSALDTMIKETLESQRRLLGNAMPQLIMESLLISWWRLNRISKAA